MLDRDGTTRQLSNDFESDIHFVVNNVARHRHHHLTLPRFGDLEIHLIDETRQKGGSFKYRGAVLGVRNNRRGVVACGSGNFPIAVGLAASSLNVPALVVMPDDAPQIKKRLAQESGSETLFVPRAEFAQIVKKEASTRGWDVLHPFANPEMLIGSCALGFELAEEIESLGSATDAVVVACGGGGLAAGLVLGLRLKGADNPVTAIEPEHYPSLAAAFAAGQPVEIKPSGHTNCDALRVTEIGKLAFDTMRKLGVSATVATDDGAAAAQLLMAEECGISAEPSGALALAALLENRIPGNSSRVWVVVCGGNI
ncbi:MAG TPA: pyridoxal-phosphate dependent enzyme [Rhizomicrobium sp.]